MEEDAGEAVVIEAVGLMIVAGVVFIAVAAIAFEVGHDLLSSVVSLASSIRAYRRIRKDRS
jgi:hypothetical protein